MKKFIQTLLAAFGLCCGCSRTDVLSPAQFSNHYAEALRNAAPELKVEVVGNLHMKVTLPNGKDSTVYLDNAYDLYKQDPTATKDVIQKYVTSFLETVSTLQTSDELDRSRIVPIVKDRPWLEDYRKALTSRGAKQIPESVFEDLNSDLVIVYAQDSPKNISYLRPEDLKKAQIDRKELRSIACENLKRLLPKIERNGPKGFYMLTAGGDYEASLLLIDSVWDDIQADVRGDVVVAIPTRSLLLVTGSEDLQGLKKMKELVQKASTKGSYRLTPKMFVRRNGKFGELLQ